MIERYVPKSGNSKSTDAAEQVVEKFFAGTSGSSPNTAEQITDAPKPNGGEQITDAPVVAPDELPPDHDAYLDALAKLDTLEYEQRRKTAAKELNIRATVLDELVAARRDLNEEEASTFMAPVQPWPEPVDGLKLLDELCDTIDEHLVLPESATEAIALWIVHAHAHDAARHSPILFITSPTKQCGKTNALALLSMLVPKALSAANVTPATVFRAIARWHPTMLIDEMDTFLSDKSDLRGVLNSGHTRSQAFVLRCVGDDLVPTQFSTWSPKAFAAIGRIHPTLEDRSIKIELSRKLRHQKVARIPNRDSAYAELRSRTARWAADSLDQLKDSRGRAERISSSVTARRPGAARSEGLKGDRS